jgi:predicted DNA-binding transcriptional regulator YafY
VRADRLVALLLLLQSRGRVTAAQVAEELEISERTARRDLEALGMAGLPVYSLPGRNGGWELAGRGRTDLSGLNAAETRALLLVAGPASSATPQLKAAVRKLVRALPEPMRDAAAAATSAIVVDPAGWEGRSGKRPAPPHLDHIQRAVLDGEQLRLSYRARNRTTSERVVHPLGLVSKGNVWYLVANTDAGLRTFRVDRVTALVSTGDPVVRPDGFDVADAWRRIADEIDERRAPLRVDAIAAPGAVDYARWIFGTRLRELETRADGLVHVELRAHSAQSIARELAAMGASIEVLAPAEVRAEIAHLARELSRLYAPD